MKTQHTALPWKVDKGLGCKKIKGGKMGKGRQAQYQVIGWTEGLHDEEKDKANAEFIVTACNSHYELIEALRKMRDFFQQYVPLVDHNGKSLNNDWDWNSIELVLKKAKA